MQKPSWAQFEKDMYSQDTDKALRAGDAFDEARKNELKTSQKARSWEEGRKKEWDKNKPEYVRKRNEMEKKKLNQSIEQLLDAGDFDSGIIPSPGFILIKLDEVPTKLGDIDLPVSNDDAPNTGTVIEVGEDDNNKFPHSKGDRVIIRKFSANLHANVNGERLYFLLFSDVLGRFKDGK